MLALAICSSSLVSNVLFGVCVDPKNIDFVALDGFEVGLIRNETPVSDIELIGGDIKFLLGGVRDLDSCLTFSGVIYFLGGVIPQRRVDGVCMVEGRLECSLPVSEGTFIILNGES